MFSRIQNLHISQTHTHLKLIKKGFSRIQNLHISQTYELLLFSAILFSRIQNLHISQTALGAYNAFSCLVEFKIYISLKHIAQLHQKYYRLVEFKIYISLKHTHLNILKERV